MPNHTSVYNAKRACVWDIKVVDQERKQAEKAADVHRASKEGVKVCKILKEKEDSKSKSASSEIPHNNVQQNGGSLRRG